MTTIKRIAPRVGDPDRDYMTPAEVSLFNRMVKNGSVTFYRIGKCEVCEKQIHKSKRFCSKSCSEGEGNGEIESETEFVD